MDVKLDKSAAISLLRELLSGYTSRNREVERFSRGPARSVYKLFRMLHSLKREVTTPGTRAWVAEGGEGLEVRVEALDYSRSVRLLPWQLEFFLEEMRAASHLAFDMNRQTENHR